MNTIAQLILPLVMMSCTGQNVASDINRPLAQAELPSTKNIQHVKDALTDFARENDFAVQPMISEPQGAVEFSTRLFRDDISVIVTQLRGRTIEVSAYPLCACELNRRIGLQSAADEAVAELKQRLVKTAKQ